MKLRLHPFPAEAAGREEGRSPGRNGPAVDPAVTILRDLVAIDSASARPNRPVVDYLAGRLDRLGFEIRLHPYRDEAGVEKVNCVARAGPGEEGGLALVGHTDTVPSDPAWSDALHLTEREGRLYGRGACDTKGFLAAALAAVEAVGTEGLVRPLWCAFTADEEVGCLGAERLAETRALRPRHAIVGEPTSLVPIRAHKGYWAAQVEVKGREGHSAYPLSGRSAIFDAARLLVEIEALARDLQKHTDPDFDPPWMSLNVGTIQGGSARNVIPGRCAFPVEWRPLPGQDGAAVERKLRGLIEELGLEARLEMVRRDPGAATPAGAEVVRFLEEATGNRSATVPFGTELPHLRALGAEAVVCGPGDIRVAHRTGEHVPREELERMVEILEKAIRHFCT